MKMNALSCDLHNFLTYSYKQKNSEGSWSRSLISTVQFPSVSTLCTFMCSLRGKGVWCFATYASSKLSQSLYFMASCKAPALWTAVWNDRWGVSLSRLLKVIENLLIWGLKFAMDLLPGSYTQHRIMPNAVISGFKWGWFSRDLPDFDPLPFNRWWSIDWLLFNVPVGKKAIPTAQPFVALCDAHASRCS